MRLIWLAAAVLLLVLALLVWAFIDGGRESVRTMVQPVAVPGGAG